MKVKELIACLKNFDPQAEVAVHYQHDAIGHCLGAADMIEVVKAADFPYAANVDVRLRDKEQVVRIRSECNL